MANRRSYIIQTLACLTCLTAHAQTEDRVVLGFNTFNEVYVGYEFPIQQETTIQRGSKISIQMGYQFALSKDANYTWGPFEMTSPFFTNNASGVRFRVGKTFSTEKGFAALFVQYHNLKSNPFTYSIFSGSSNAPVYIFEETYQKYGLRLMNALSIGGSTSAYFSFSVALFFT